MVESLFALLVCFSAFNECNVHDVTLDLEACEETKVKLIKTNGAPPEGITVSCVKYSKE